MPTNHCGVLGDFGNQYINYIWDQIMGLWLLEYQRWVLLCSQCIPTSNDIPDNDHKLVGGMIELSH